MLSKEDSILRIENLKMWFSVRRNFLGRIFSGKQEYIKAVDGVSFDVYEKEVLGIVGESGCGKTTLGRLIVGLIKPMEGKIYYQGEEIKSFNNKIRRNIQMIFQDPYQSLNPRMNIFSLLIEPIIVHSLTKSEDEEIKIVKNALTDVGLVPPKEFMYRYPHELSGGQRQRVSLARALCLNPRFLVADEPVSMLDVSLRAGILKILLQLRDDLGLSQIFITHDLAVAKHICDRIAVMYLGKIVEIGNSDDVINCPIHPYTHALISAAPRLFMTGKGLRVAINDEASTTIPPKDGCNFYPRCKYSENICREIEPAFVEINKRYVACHNALYSARAAEPKK